MMTSNKNQNKIKFMGAGSALVVFALFLTFAVEMNRPVVAQPNSPAPELLEEAVPAAPPQVVDEQNDAPISKLDTTVFWTVEKMPQFPGGQEALMKYLSTNVDYPDYAQEHGLMGRVYVSFVVSKEGEVDRFKILRSDIKKYEGLQDTTLVKATAALEQESLRVLKEMPDWIPGTQRGNKVNVRYVLPVNYVLQ